MTTLNDGDYLNDGDSFEIDLIQDPLEKEEMGDTEVLDDTSIKDTRLIIHRLESSISDNNQGINIIFKIVFHSAINYHFRYANIEFEFPENILVSAIDPKDEEKFITINKSQTLDGALGTETKPINATISSAHETKWEYQQIFEHISGSGEQTQTAKWIFEVHKYNQNGLPKETILKVTIPIIENSIECKLKGNFRISNGIFERIIKIFTCRSDDYVNNKVFKIAPFIQ